MNSQKPVTITYRNLNRTVEVENTDKNLLDQSIFHRIPHVHECGGYGMCTTCRIRILDGAENLSPPTERETELSEARAWDPSIRLACQTKINSGSVTLERIIWTNAEVSSLQLEALTNSLGEERELAILFCDMRNFTLLAGAHGTFDLAHMLNRYFTEMGDPILMNNGVIYQYVGDEIVALFGTTGGDAKTVCTQAVRAALGMQYAVDRLNKWDMGNFDAQLSIGVGLHYGPAFVGNVGHPRHKQFAVIGDTVNVASRIQSVNKELDTRILASKSLYDALGENVIREARVTDVQLRGKEEAHTVYEITGFHHGDVHLEVQRTLNELLKDEAGFAEHFYTTLFDRHPHLERLFKHNLMDQGKLLTHMLRGVVYSLSRPEHLVAGLKKLGQQHEDYGVRPEHYPIVKEILMETIETQLGDVCTENVRAAWEQAIAMVVELMEPKMAEVNQAGGAA